MRNFLMQTAQQSQQTLNMWIKYWDISGVLSEILFFVLFDFKQNIFRFWSIPQGKQAQIVIYNGHFWLFFDIL